MTTKRHRRLPLADLLLALATITLLTACGGEDPGAAAEAPAVETVPELEAVDAAPGGESAGGVDSPNPAEEAAVAEATAPRENAREVLAAALAEAQRSDRMVFLHSGAPW